MLSLLIVSLAAGLCHAQKPSDYSDCANAQSIANDCATSHLDYLKAISMPDYNAMLMLSNLEQPDFLLDKLGNICNDTMHLKEYYKCAYSSLTTCLEAENSTQAIGLADSKTISMGIVEFCNGRTDINGTCIKENVAMVGKCFMGIVQGPKGQSGDACLVHEELLTCAEKLLPCSGGDVVKDFMVSTRPHGCPYTGSGQRFLGSALLIMVMLLGYFVSFL